MNKEDLYPLIGKYLNGYEIVKVEEDPFVKGQINLWTSEQMTGYFGDKSIVKFIIRPEGNSSKIYQELVDKEIYQLKNKNKKQKEVIDRVNKYLHTSGIQQCYNGRHYRGLDGLQVQVLEDILNEVSE